MKFLEKNDLESTLLTDLLHGRWLMFKVWLMIKNSALTACQRLTLEIRAHQL
jgi:hypothetical protein